MKFSPPWDIIKKFLNFEFVKIFRKRIKLFLIFIRLINGVVYSSWVKLVRDQTTCHDTPWERVENHLIMQEFVKQIMRTWIVTLLFLCLDSAKNRNTMKISCSINKPVVFIILTKFWIFRDFKFPWNCLCIGVLAIRVIII